MVEITKVESIRTDGQEQFGLWVELTVEGMEPIHVQVSPAMILDYRQLQSALLKATGYLFAHSGVEGRGRTHAREMWLTYLHGLMRPPVVMARPPVGEN